MSDLPVPASTPNVANKPGTAKSTAERKRIPMSTPQRKLEVNEADFPGYRLYWFLGANCSRAIQGGYEFVDSKDVTLNSRSIGSDSTLSGNADLGSRVSVIAGMGANGQPESLFLMKIKEEWFKEDQHALEAKNQLIADAIRGKQAFLADGEQAVDARNRYVKTAAFNQSKRKP